MMLCKELGHKKKCSQQLAVLNSPKILTVKQNLYICYFIKVINI